MSPGKIADHVDVRPPTDATQSRPYLNPVSGLPLTAQPLAANRWPPTPCYASQNSQERARRASYGLYSETFRLPLFAGAPVSCASTVKATEKSSLR